MRNMQPMSNRRSSNSHYQQQHGNPQSGDRLKSSCGGGAAPPFQLLFHSTVRRDLVYLSTVGRAAQMAIAVSGKQLYITAAQKSCVAF